MTVSSFLVVISLLVIFSILDVRNRIVRNELILGGLIVGCVILLMTGHFILFPLLHMTALILVIPIAYILFRLGSIGGADVKVLFTIAILSPGIEFGDWSQPILEAIFGLGGEMIIMILGGYLFWRKTNKEDTPPLIPMLLIGYLFVQLIALI
jgi:hypothetical protein